MMYGWSADHCDTVLVAQKLCAGVNKDVTTSHPDYAFLASSSLSHTFTHTERSRGFIKKGVIHLSTYLKIYKVSDYVDVKVNGSIHKGTLHGCTERVWNVTKREVNKQVCKSGFMFGSQTLETVSPMHKNTKKSFLKRLRTCIAMSTRDLDYSFQMILVKKEEAVYRLHCEIDFEKERSDITFFRKFLDSLSFFGFGDAFNILTHKDTYILFSGPKTSKFKKSKLVASPCFYLLHPAFPKLFQTLKSLTTNCAYAESGCANSKITHHQLRICRIRLRTIRL